MKNYKIMKYMSKLMLLSILVLVACSKNEMIDTQQFTETPASPDSPQRVGGNLIWSDEFNATSLDLTKWFQLRGNSSYSYGDPCNPELEDAYYTTNNSYVSNGSLVLNMSTTDAGGYPYSSGWVQSYPAFTFQYGYIEARIKIPNFSGSWPAFWLVNANDWPPEVDIFEHWNPGSQVKFNYYWKDQSGNPQKIGTTPYGSSTPWDDYHVYGFYWGTDRVQVYFDGIPGPSYTNTANITNLPMFIIINLALQKGYTPTGVMQMLIDYVRVYDSMPCTPTTITPYVQVNSGTWQQTSNVTVNYGDQVNLGPQPATGGTWSWSGCGVSGLTDQEVSFTATNTCVATATYTNESGCESTQDFNITVNGGVSISLVNGTFETGNLTGWTGWGTRSVVNTNQYAGSYCGRVYGSGALEQVITGLQPNTTYTLKAYCKVSSGTYARLGVKDFGGSEVYTSCTNISYSQKNRTFTTGSNNTTAKIYWYNTTKKKYAYVDNVTVE